MAQVDVKWPSEDEEFDTTTENTDANSAEPTKVNVIEHGEDSSDSTEVESSLEETQPETAAESTDESEGAAETAPEVPDVVAEESTPEESSVPAQEEATPDETPEPQAEPEPEAESPAPQEEAVQEETMPEVEASTPEQPAETPDALELGTSIAPEATSAPVATSESAAVSETAPEQEKPQTSSKMTGSVHHYGRDLLIFVLVLIIAGLGLWSWTLYADKQNLQEQLTSVKNNPQAEIDRQAKELVATVNKLTPLPNTEEPTIQTVTDAKLARQQADFYAKSENGDKVLLYVNTRKAFLYRPSTNKVITIAPIQFDSSEKTSATNAAATNANSKTTNTSTNRNSN